MGKTMGNETFGVYLNCKWVDKIVFRQLYKDISLNKTIFNLLYSTLAQAPLQSMMKVLLIFASNSS